MTEYGVSGTGSGNPPGLDLDAFAEFFATACPGEATGTLRGEVIAGGKSNLTYEVTDGNSTWIVRRPPLGHVLATAHDMAREHRVITALGPTEVPVPRTYVLCEDPEVLGAPFYVMEKVPGTPYRRSTELEALGPERARAISGRMVDTLATLHRVDPAAVGLADFGRPEGFLERQVRRWRKQLDASYSRHLAGVEELHALLGGGTPEQTAAAVVHGDFRLDNLLVDEADTVRAVLDWEMATLGDPLTDVGLMVVYQRLAGVRGGTVGVSDVSLAPGYLAEQDLLARYAAASGRDLSDLGFYLGLAYFKLAVILEGIYYRHTHGQTVGAGFDSVGDGVEPLIAAGITALKENR